METRFHFTAMHLNRPDYCPLAGEPCQSMCEVPCGQGSSVKPMRQALRPRLVDGGFNAGTPPDSLDAAWLLMHCNTPDGAQQGVYTVLAVQVQGAWHAAGDWRADTYAHHVGIDGDTIAGWLPFDFPAPVLKPDNGL